MTTAQLSDAEVIALIGEAEQQLAEYMKLGKLTVLGDVLRIHSPVPSYRWDNPIGLVIGDFQNGFMVSATTST
jgi:hypothetical protein